MPLMVELASSALPIDPEGRITFPPEIVRPESEERPDAEIPPANVDVAVEEELIPPPALRSLATLRVLAKVEEACTERFWVEMDEEAESVPMFTFCTNVEEAEETRPPDDAIEKRVEVPAPRDCWTWKALPVCPVKSMRERRLETVEGGLIVSSSVPQVMYPSAFVSRTEVPEQARRLLILIPVAVSSPPWKVEVAVEEELIAWSCARSETFSLPAMVEEAEE